jgi:hypothetical protein
MALHLSFQTLPPVEVEIAAVREAVEMAVRALGPAKRVMDI